MVIKCYDASKSLIEEFEKHIKKGFRIDCKKVQKYKTFCDNIDKLMLEWESEYIDIELMNNGCFHVALDSFEVEINKESRTFQSLLVQCTAFEVRPSSESDDNNIVTFIFPSIVSKDN